MKKTRNILLTAYCGLLSIAAVLYVCGEFAHLDMAVFYDTSREVAFFLPTLMILLTLALVPLALRLFKFQSIHQDLMQRKSAALLKWGLLRIGLLGGLLVVNTLLYYAFGTEPTYGYLAVVVMLSMVFVLPTKSRCQAETEEPIEPALEDAPDNVDEPGEETLEEEGGDEA